MSAISTHFAHINSQMGIGTTETGVPDTLLQKCVSLSYSVQVLAKCVALQGCCIHDHCWSCVILRCTRRRQMPIHRVRIRDGQVLTAKSAPSLLAELVNTLCEPLLIPNGTADAKKRKNGKSKKECQRKKRATPIHI